MDDLVERLRERAPYITKPNVAAVMFDAAAHIQALEASLAEVTEDRDLWKQSEAVASAQYDKACEKLAEAEGRVEEARRQAFEEAAKVADGTMREEITGVQLGSSYRSGIRWAGERIKDAIRALASDALLDRHSPPPPPVV